METPFNVEQTRFMNFGKRLARKLTEVRHECEQDDLRMMMNALNLLDDAECKAPWTAAKSVLDLLVSGHAIDDEDMIGWLHDTVDDIDDGSAQEELANLRQLYAVLDTRYAVLLQNYETLLGEVKHLKSRFTNVGLYVGEEIRSADDALVKALPPEAPNEN